MATNKGKKQPKKQASAAKKTNFWTRLPKPFFVLAPMANVTDAVFRQIIAKYGKPDVTWTEFVSADGLCSPKGKKALIRDLDYTEKERPIVAQLFTGHILEMKKAAQLCAKHGFDGVDINTGCPDRSVEKQGGGASMIKDPANAVKVIKAAIEGAGPKIPVSVKARIGYNTVDWKWVSTLLELKLPAITFHLRTRKEMSDVPAHWELMPKIVKLRNEISPDTLIIGNGDVTSLVQARELARKTGCDGVMIGRGIFGTPWFFSGKEKTTLEKLKIMLEHTKLFEKTYCGKKHIKNFAVMKKHFKAYVSGFDNAKELRVELMNTNSYKEVKSIVDNYIAHNAGRL